MSKTRKTIMSVPEMRQLLGIGKTDSYWLVHKQCFETILVEGKMRVVIDSFEHWYANQIKYKKVDGTPPGEELRSNSYSPPEIAEMLGLSESVIYDIIKRYDIETFQADYWTRVRKDVFEAWYKSQTKYRTKEDRERDAELEAASMTMPEMARLLMPTEQTRITELFAELIEKNDLPKVVFHSLRHSSITYKLKLNGGDIKSVQGDSGHAQAQMVTDQYSHILDDDRRNNAALFEKAFYSGKGADSIEASKEAAKEAAPLPSNVDPELVAKILANPEMAALLTSLAKSIL